MISNKEKSSDITLNFIDELIQKKGLIIQGLYDKYNQEIDLSTNEKINFNIIVELIIVILKGKSVSVQDTNLIIGLDAKILTNVLDEIFEEEKIKIPYSQKDTISTSGIITYLYNMTLNSTLIETNNVVNIGNRNFIVRGSVKYEILNEQGVVKNTKNGSINYFNGKCLYFTSNSGYNSYKKVNDSVIEFQNDKGVKTIFNTKTHKVISKYIVSSSKYNYKGRYDKDWEEHKFNDDTIKIWDTKLEIYILDLPDIESVHQNFKAIESNGKKVYTLKGINYIIITSKNGESFYYDIDSKKIIGKYNHEGISELIKDYSLLLDELKVIKRELKSDIINLY